MRKIYFSLLALFVSICSMAQITLPLDFEGAGPYNWTDFSGGVTTVIDNPQKSGINVSNKVSKTIKMAGDPWGGSWIALTSPIDFSTMKTLRMKVFSPRVGAKVTLKVENGANTAVNLEKEKLTTVANTWEDLTFDFSAILLPNTYDRVVVIFDNGTPGNGSANFTFLFDDIRQEGAPSGALTLPTLPVTFESATVDYSFSDFDGGGTTVVANTQKSGNNFSDTLARMVKSAGQSWGGSVLTMAGAMDFSTNKIFRVKVFSPKIGTKLLLKVEGTGPAFEREVTMTKVNEWEDLTFDYSAVSTSNQYNKLVFIFDLGTMGDGSANFTFLFDDIRLVAGGGGGLTQMNLPVTFDDPTVNYGVIGFGGADASSIVADPTNAANKVAKVIKGAGAENWAGTTVSAAGGGGFSAKLPFAPGSTFMNVRVWSPLAGIPVRLKVEDSGDPTKSVETEALTTVAGGWQNLVFNFTVPTIPATAPINFAFNYNKASIFFNYGPGGATVERTYYFDDMVFGAAPLPVRLLSFDAKKEQTAVAFTWTTAQEVNNKGFAVQRSMNGQKWTNIAEIAGNGTRSGTHSYTAKDVLPIAGLNYYRLKQEDFDGASVYSAVKVIDFSGTQLNAVKVYPNPAKNSLNVVSAAFAGRVSYTIQSAEGRQVTSGNMNQTLSAQPIDISKLKTGIYYIVLRDGTTTQTVKFMVK